MSYQYIQLGYLDKMAAGDPEARRQLLLMLVNDLETSRPRVKALWEGRKRAELQGLCHHLKSTFPFVGNERLAGANRLMEQLLREGKNLDRLYPLLLEMDNLIPKALKELRQELGKR